MTDLLESCESSKAASPSGDGASAVEASSGHDCPECVAGQHQQQKLLLAVQLAAVWRMPHTCIIATQVCQHSFSLCIELNVSALQPAYLRAERLGSKAMCQERSCRHLARALRILSIQSRHWAAEWLAFLHHTKSPVLVFRVQCKVTSLTCHDCHDRR